LLDLAPAEVGGMAVLHIGGPSSGSEILIPPSFDTRSTFMEATPLLVYVPLANTTVTKAVQKVIIKGWTTQTRSSPMMKTPTPVLL
jgi:hypothetical protein